MLTDRYEIPSTGPSTAEATRPNTGAGARGYAVGADEGVPRRDAEVKASSDVTGGSVAIYESVINGAGPPPHTHTREDKTIYVLDGHIEAECGDTVFVASRGGVIFLPRHQQHTFRSVGGPATILLIVTPSHLDGFFVQRDRALAQGAERGAMVDLARSFGVA